MGKQLIILVGPPGSGKSSLSVQQGFTRVSQDDQGKGGHMEVFNRAIEAGENIIVDRMNFNKEQRWRYIKEAGNAGYHIEIVTLFVPYDVCLKRCIARKDHPTIKDEENARAALRTFFTKFEKPTLDEANSLRFSYWKDPDIGDHAKPDCMIVDLDGTMCKIDHRLHYVRREGKKDWVAFFRGLIDDEPNKWCVDIVRKLAGRGWSDEGQEPGYQVVFCSGRPNDYRLPTMTWLVRHVPVISWDLFMRHEGDHRQDNIVKEMLLDFEILTRYRPQFAIDDRQQVVDMWRSRGITTLQCAKGDF